MASRLCCDIKLVNVMICVTGDVASDGKCAVFARLDEGAGRKGRQGSWNESGKCGCLFLLLGAIEFLRT